MLKQNEKYYIIAHVYLHYIGEVVDVMPYKVTLKNAIQVISCKRGWTDFFAKGCQKDTQYELMPDGIEVPSDLVCIPWNHEIPNTPCAK